MIIVLATIRQEIAKLEALCIKKTLQKKGYVNIKVKVSVQQTMYHRLYLVRIEKEACQALGWEVNPELNNLLGNTTISSPQQLKAHLN